MKNTPYSNAIGSIMYLMVSTIPDIAYAISCLSRDNRKSTTSYVFTLCGACISWKSQLQNIVALSTTEAEYIATTEAFKEAIWLEGTCSRCPTKIEAVMIPKTTRNLGSLVQAFVASLLWLLVSATVWWVVGLCGWFGFHNSGFGYLSLKRFTEILIFDLSVYFHIMFLE
ncbi:UNVERIFIED_CONTAM: Retrovirus-related Pol polyprotein from transposon TNT 1-94 [Sesamum calycinum]|uniref:Retrovirus-related Pol polyprotein from transposon TNT 1-94 n=1 Tax=Sesamum calycinum TaxID=2727403 RepID=A0AAW2R948_9LAMI